MEAKTFAAFIINRLGKVNGKKAFQKLVYLAKAEGVPFNYSYKMHYYGPYSEVLAEDFESLYYEDFIDASEGAHIYTAGTKLGEDVLGSDAEIGQYRKELDSVINKFGKMSPLELEIYATAHFIWKTQVIFHRPSDRATVIKEIVSAKYPKFSLDCINKAYDDMVKWGLIKTA